MSDKRNILICPLDWGLGHAARCVPIIRAMLGSGLNVIIAADGRPYDFLKIEFPELHHLRLPGCRVKYPESGSMALKMLCQAPGIVTGIIRERRILRDIVDRYKIDFVISDNRFGLWSRAVPSVYITHQIMVKCPAGLRFLEPLLYRLHSWFINRYTECWIPDFEGEPNLSGDLTHSYPLPGNTRFIGPLSRFSMNEEGEPLNDLLVILSGPEPQRSILERIVLTQVKNSPLKVLIARGKTEEAEETAVTEDVRMVSHLETEELNRAILSSRQVLARAGYSTIMDLALLGKKAILIPTPGQTEQEYLADRFMRKKIYYSEPQSGFNLARALKETEGYSGIDLSADTTEVVTGRIVQLMGCHVRARDNTKMPTSLSANP